MPSPIKMRTDYSAPQLRVLAKSAKTNSQSRRLLSLAAVLDGTAPVATPRDAIQTDWVTEQVMQASPALAEPQQ